MVVKSVDHVRMLCWRGDGHSASVGGFDIVPCDYVPKKKSMIEAVSKISEVSVSR